MSNPLSIALDHTVRLRSIELKISLIAWGIYLAGMCAYCLSYQAIVRATTPDLVGTVTVALREWGYWIVATPLVFKTLTRWQQCGDRSIGNYMRLAISAVLGAVAVPLVIDQLTHTRDAAASLVIFFPRNLVAFGVVYLVWHALLRQSTPAERSHEPDLAGEHALPLTLLVSKGADECLIHIKDIQCVSASGNYLAICVRNQRYLLRATMKQIEARLPADRFVRIHRSHIVELAEIERINVHRSGSGTVYLRSGGTLPISRNYRAQLQRSRPPRE